MTIFLLNDKQVTTTAPITTMILDVIRNEFAQRGTREGCREGDCGACTILVGKPVQGHVQYRTAASCLLPVGSIEGAHVVTIEGLNGVELTPVQQALADEGATQCGFCTPGIVLALTGFLLTSPSLSLDDACSAIAGNICRCTGYTSIHRAARRLVERVNLPVHTPAMRIKSLVHAGLLPGYFLTAHDQLTAIQPIPNQAQHASIMAGGTDLFVHQDSTLTSKPLRYLEREQELQGVEMHNDHIAIGAATTTEDLRQNEILCNAFPQWGYALGLISSTTIRNRATIGGNLINASPIGDLSIILLALNAELRITGQQSQRNISLDNFFQAYKQVDLGVNELLTRIVVPLPTTGSSFHFEKVSRREHLDIASVNTAIHIKANNETITEARISAGGVAPVPLLLGASSRWLVGQPLAPETVKELIHRVDREVKPIDDIRGSATYKRLLLGRLLIAHLSKCLPGLDLQGVLT